MHITGSILMINGLLHFFFFQKKKLLCIQEYKKPISLPKRKKMLHEKKSTCTAFSSTSSFSARCFASQSLKLYKSVFYWSLYRLSMLQPNKNNDEIIFANLNKSHKLLLKLPSMQLNEKHFQIDR